MKKLCIVIFVLTLVGCSDSAAKPNFTEKPDQREGETPVTKKEPSEEIIAQNLQSPWSINLHNGIFYISERGGTIAVIENGKVNRQKVEFSSPLSSAAEAGLMGFVLKKDFDQTKEAYAYYTFDKNGSPFNRIVTLKQNGDQWMEKEIHLDNVPSGDYHHGGRLEFSPEGELFATVGDAIRPELAQDSNSYNGKVLKMDDTGNFNIFTKGHRNPQGLAWNENGVLYSSEHGSQANDEINRLVEGHNYGWPIIQGEEQRTGLETPFLTSGPEETWAPSGITFHKGKMVVAALRGEAILLIDTEKGAIGQKIEGFGRIRDVYSDGESLYFITNNTDGRGSPSNDDDLLYRIP